VKRHIDQRRRGEFHGIETGIERSRGQHLVEQGLRHRLAGLEMHGIALQDSGHRQPVLIKLRRQLDEIARNTGAGNGRVGNIRQHAVQRVAEFVEQRARVVERQQRRLAFRRLGEVADIIDDWQFAVAAVLQLKPVLRLQ
jgi:hypothetical protein